MENNISTFSVFRIGPALAMLLSKLDKSQYVFKTADYHAVLWDWDGKNPSYVGCIDESCFVLTTSKSAHPCYAENICLSHVFDSPRDDGDICLGFNNYSYRNHQNIVDGKISFYEYEDESKKRIISFPYADLVYGFIDELINYKLSNQLTEPTSDTIFKILDSYLKNNDLEEHKSRLLIKKDV